MGDHSTAHSYETFTTEPNYNWALSDNVTALSDNVMALSDNVTALSDNVTALSDNVTASLGAGGSYARKRDIFKFWRASIFGIGGTSVCSIGIICNLTAILVLANFKNKSSAPVLLICLAISDTIYLTCRLFLETIPSLIYDGFIPTGYRDNVMPTICVMYPAYLVAQCLGIYLVIIITLERYTVIVWPFRAHKFCNLRTSITAVLCLLVLVILYHIPFYCAHECVYGYNNVTKTNITNFQRTSFGHSYFYIKVFYKWINPMVIFALPFLLLLSFNGMTLRALWRDRNVTSAAQNRAKHEQRLTVMVLCMTFVFFLFELMAALAFILTSGEDSYIHLSEDMIRFTTVSDLGLLINSAINFAIYCSTGKKFRDTFRQLTYKLCHFICFYPLSLCRKRREPLTCNSESDVTRCSVLGPSSVKVKDDTSLSVKAKK